MARYVTEPVASHMLTFINIHGEHYTDILAESRHVDVVIVMLQLGQEAAADLDQCVSRLRRAGFE